MGLFDLDFGECNIGVGTGVDVTSGADESMGTLSIESVTVESLLKEMGTSLALDISKNSTGISFWKNGELHVSNYHIPVEYTDSDPFSEIKMRLDFKRHLTSLFKGEHFDTIIVEDVFGGDNFSTVRKLLALNTVIDELVIEEVITVENFYRQSNQTWKSNMRSIYKAGKGLKDKFEIEQVALHLGFGYALEHKSDTDAQKSKEGYQDILDATMMLCSVSALKNSEIKTKKSSRIKKSDIEFDFIEDLEYLDYSDKELYSQYPYLEISRANKKATIEKVFVDSFNNNEEYEEYILALHVSNGEVGLFGIEHSIPTTEGYILGYLKNIKKKNKISKKKS